MPPTPHAPSPLPFSVPSLGPGRGVLFGAAALVAIARPAAARAGSVPFPTPPSTWALHAVPAHTPAEADEAVLPPPADTYRDLSPVRTPYLAWWQQATARTMAGDGASAWYRDTATQLDVQWRLAEMSPEQVFLEDGVRNRAVDMVLVGAMSGWNATLRRALRATPELVPLQTAIQAALTPGLHIQKGASGQTRVQAADPASRNQQAALADINQGPTVDATGRMRKPPRSIRTGSAVTLFRLPSSSDIDAGATNNNPIAPGLSSWVEVREVLVDAARVQTRLEQPAEGGFRPTLRWVAVARQGLMPSWAVIADLQGTRGEVRPTRSGVAVEHNLSHMGLPAWAMRVNAAQEQRPELGDNIREQRVMFTVRTNFGWYLPQDVDRWPLGHQPGAPGPVLPDLAPSGPGAPRPLAQSPAQRAGTGPVQTDGIADQ